MQGSPLRFNIKRLPVEISASRYLQDLPVVTISSSEAFKRSERKHAVQKYLGQNGHGGNLLPSVHLDIVRLSHDYLRRSTGRQNSTSAVPQTTNLNTNNMGCRLPGRFASLGTKKTNRILLGGDTTVTHPRRS